MAKPRIYDLVKEIMTDYPKTRNSDKALHFTVWNKLGLVDGRSISYEKYLKAPSTETIRRSRQKIQELHPELRATSATVRQARRQKQQSKGTFIYREETRLW